MKSILLVLLSLVAIPVSALQLKDCKLTEAQQQDSMTEHVYGGVLDTSDTHKRRAYVLTYNEKYLVPHWVAWHAQKAYRQTPERKSRWKSFRVDPELSSVSPGHYDGWHGSEFNYARGHLVPHFIGGGDRDHDGKLAAHADLRVLDKDDACTVYEINAMSNVAPQYHKRFNGSGGVWNRLESDIRNMLDDGASFNLFAGSIFLKDEKVHRIGPSDNLDNHHIGVPHGYFKVIINLDRQEAVAFLFDHEKNLDKGCDLPSTQERASSLNPSQCIVKVEDIETLTELNFFKSITAAESARLRNSSSLQTWYAWQASE